MKVDLIRSREFLRRRSADRQAALDKRFAQATAEARAIVALAAQRYRPKRIYQWGSLLDRSRFWEHSDVDVAVEGLASAGQFFALYGDADRLTSFPLDLVELERIEPEYAELIRTKGRLVYEREREDRDAA